ncbi:hypothetical protein BH10ACT9_BH10ACT9_36530 [soil metagenome]
MLPNLNSPDKPSIRTTRRRFTLINGAGTKVPDPSERVIPDVRGMAPAGAAKAYGLADLSILPVAAGKHPGSIVGKGWPSKSTTDTAQIDRTWSEHPDAGIAVHTGAAGLTFIDLDVDAVPDELAWLRTGVVQFSRAAEVKSERGHYGFATGDEIFTSGDLKLKDGTKVGEIRSGNSVIIASPSPHVHAETKNGEYRWRETDIGRPIPALPQEARSYLRPLGTRRQDGSGASPGSFSVEASGEAVQLAVREWTGNARPAKLAALVRWVENADAGTRNATRDALRIAASESRLGLFPFNDAIEGLRAATIASYRLRDESDKFSEHEYRRSVANGVGYAQSRSLDDIAAEAERGGVPGVSDGESESSEKRSHATMLVALALERFSLGISTESKPFGCHPDTPHVALDLRGGKLGLRQTLSRDFFRRYNAAPATAAITSACGVLEGEARETAPVDLYLRVASDAKAVYVDVADAANRVIEIASGTWQLVSTAPVMFRRTELTAAMPEPVRGGDVALLWRHINIDEADRPLLLAVLVDCLIQPSTAKNVVALTGEHGTAKSGTSRRLIALIDPSAVPLSAPPRDAEAWLSAASSRWVVGLDNLSGIPDWLSDAICRAATGEGTAKRQLYSDDSVVVSSFRRCVLLNGIDFGSVRGDLADRLVSFELQPITARATETALNEAWAADHPMILGGLLDLAAEVHALLPELPPSELPRMADFGRVLLAVDKILGTDGMQRYRERLSRAMANSALSSPFIEQLIDEKYDTGKAGLTAGEILNEVNQTRLGLSAPQGWPKSAKTVTALLKRNAPALRSMGWRIDNDGGANRNGTTRWSIHPGDLKSPKSDPKRSQTGKTGGESKRSDLRTRGMRRGR